MIVKITEAAMNKLKEMTRKDAQIPRIDAAIAGGCGVSVKFSLVLDDPAETMQLLNMREFSLD
ncbi:iron-sulfur cluster biosynthesis family protein [Peribacillus simplex]|uniref:iron-sulfur cluster biosynthesis family protein n=1 Tax=Peribacillus simplex TaxID=1478 RepID=UPI001F4F8945|nr:iron-sulfur cluster biosynthesis family protein [Peribacillus simplex]